MIKRYLRGNHSGVILLNNYSNSQLLINSFKLEYLKNHPNLKINDIILFGILTEYENRSSVFSGCEDGAFIDGCSISGTIWNNKKQVYELVPFHYVLVHSATLTNVIRIKVTNNKDEFENSDYYKCPTLDSNDKTKTPLFYTLLPVNIKDKKDFILNRIAIYI